IFNSFNIANNQINQEKMHLNNTSDKPATGNIIDSNSIKNNTRFQSGISTEYDTFSTWYSFQTIMFFISMYVFAFSLNQVVSQYINYFTGSSSLFFYKSYLDFFLAVLVVSYVLFSIFFVLSEKNIHKVKEIRNFKERKNWIYTTLVLSSVIGSISIIVALYNFLLNGLTNMDYILQLINVVIITGVIFLYYLREVKIDVS
ncbi:hypothetical protein M1145_01980, partial [Patescibacteria group bacterium]|nr:hypothetical protein [Patescibacteria group bacterium]